MRLVCRELQLCVPSGSHLEPPGLCRECMLLKCGARQAAPEVLQRDRHCACAKERGTVQPGAGARAGPGLQGGLDTRHSQEHPHPTSLDLPVPDIP